jgi:DeoR/GlpR family transcriptional regulator of sugar metabolism
MRSQRELAILDQLRELRAASVTELAAATGSSIATIRRDLQRLDESGVLTRTRGGAMLAEGDSPFAIVEPAHREAKERIAAAAAAAIEDGQSVLLDIGTTTLHLARRLRGRPVTVITANMAIFETLHDDPAVHLVMLPGDYDPVYRCVYGHLTVESLRLVRADHAFLGVSGISATGDLRDTTLAQVPIKQAMAEASDRLTVLADSSKFPGSGLGCVMLPNKPITVITEAQPSEAISEALKTQSVEVVLA